VRPGAHRMEPRAQLPFRPPSDATRPQCQPRVYRQPRVRAMIGFVGVGATPASRSMRSSQRAWASGQRRAARCRCERSPRRSAGHGDRARRGRWRTQGGAWTQRPRAIGRTAVGDAPNMKQPVLAPVAPMLAKPVAASPSGQFYDPSGVAVARNYICVARGRVAVDDWLTELRPTVTKRDKRAVSRSAEAWDLQGESNLGRPCRTACHAEGRGFEPHQPLGKSCKSTIYSLARRLGSDGSCRRSRVRIR
jgi:hypothetical protein